MFNITNTVLVPRDKYKPGMFVMFNGRKYKVRCECRDAWPIDEWIDCQCGIVDGTCPECTFHPWIIMKGGR